MNEFRKNFNLYTCYNNGEPKQFICTLKTTQSKVINQVFNILELKYGKRINIEYLPDIKNNYIFWRKKLSIYPRFVLVQEK